jgi:hypothetical protein
VISRILPVRPGSCCVHELMTFSGADFHLLPHTLLRRALDTLVKKGKAQVFKGEDGEGVKFV